MAQRFLANLSVLVLLNLLVKPVYIFGIEVAVQNRVGPEAYGLYFALLNTAYLLQIVNDFGLQIYNNRLVAIDPRQISTSFRSITALKVILGIAFLLLLYVLGVILGYTVHLNLLALVGVNMTLVSFVLYLRSNISGLGLYRTDSILSVTDKALMIAVCGMLLLFLEDSFTIYHFLIAQFISLCITALVSLILVTRHQGGDQNKAEVSSIFHVVRRAAPYALGVFLMTVYTRIDGVMIEQIALNGEYQNGLYAAGYRLLDALNMVAFLFAALLLPMFSKLIDQRQQTIGLLGQGFRLMGVMTITAAASCYAYSDQIMAFLYPAATGEWGRVFGLLVLSFISIGMMYIFGTLLTAHGLMRRLNLVYGFCVVANIISNTILIPAYGAWGAALATLLTQGLAAALLMIFAIRMLGIGKLAGPIFASVAYLGLSLAFSAGVAQYANYLPWTAGFVITGCTVIGAALLLRIISISEFRALLGQ